MDFDFNKHLELETLDSVPEVVRPFYKEDEGGKFKLDSDNLVVKTAVSSITKLNRSLKASRAEAQGFKGKAVDLAKLSEFGDSPESILEGFETKLKEAATKSGDTNAEDIKRQIEKVRTDLSKTHTTELESRDTRIGTLNGQLHSLLVVGEGKAALAPYAIDGDVDLSLPFLQRQTRVQEENGVMTVVVIDDEGHPRYSGVTGALMTVKELASEMNDTPKFAPLFKSQAPAGGGMQPARKSGPSRTTGELTSTQKIASGLKKGQHGGNRV